MTTQKVTNQVVPAPSELVDLRHKAKHLTFFPKRQAVAAMAGGYRSRFRGRGMDFDEVRPYQPGDDIRTIDWRVTARTTRPHTKVFREERERPVLIVTDLRNSMFFGSRKLKSVLAAEIAATLAWAGLRANDRVGGMIFGPTAQKDIRSGRSHHNVLRFIHELCDGCEALITPQVDTVSLREICEDVRRVATPGSSIVLISDFADVDHEAEKHLFQLRRHCDLTLAEIYDPLESELPPPGFYPVTNGENRSILNTADATLRKNFQFERQRHWQLIDAMANRLGIGKLRFSTAEDYMPLLLRHYSHNGKSPTSNGTQRSVRQ